jgi:NADPH-dependent glutamate synthase beta subunit-like oxidoreductase
VELIFINDGTRERLPADALMIASGRFPELILTRVKEEKTPEAFIDLNPETLLKWEGISPYKKPEYHDQTGILAKGDDLSDFSAMIKAIGAGRRGAASIHQLMYSIFPSLPDHVLTPDSDIQNVFGVYGVAAKPRQLMPLSSMGELERGIEIEKGYTSEMAQAEANRCLQCGLICYKRSEDESTGQAAAVQ